MRSRLALTAAIGAMAVAGCAGSRSSWPPVDTRPAPAVVQRLLGGITDDISAVSHRYPELSRWHLRRAHRMGFVYELRGRGVRPRLGKGYIGFGRHGCLLSVSVFRPVTEPGPRQMRAPPIPGELISIREPVPGLDLVVLAHLSTGEVTSDGFAGEIERIFTERIGALQEKRADPSAPPEPAAQ
jgi:hypothetical protein